MRHLMSLSTATAEETLGIDVEKGDERLEVYISYRFSDTPIAFLRALGDERSHSVTFEEVQEVVQFHANLKKSQRKGRS